MDEIKKIAEQELNQAEMDKVAGGFLVEIIQKAADDIDRLILHPHEPEIPSEPINDTSDMGGQ